MKAKHNKDCEEIYEGVWKCSHPPVTTTPCCPSCEEKCLPQINGQRLICTDASCKCHSSPCCTKCLPWGAIACLFDGDCLCHSEGKGLHDLAFGGGAGITPQESAVEKPLRIVMPIDLKENVDARKRLAGVPDPSATPPVEEWEREFDKQFVTVDDEGVKVVKPKDDEDDGTSLWQSYPIKIFIRNLLSQTRRSERASLAEKVEGIQIDPNFTGHWRNGYYHAKNEIIRLLST